MRNWLDTLFFGLQSTVLMLVPPRYSFDRLERFCRRKLDSKPIAFAPRLFLANLYLDYSRYADAKREFEVLLKNGHDDEAIRKSLGIACYRLAEYAEALKHLELTQDSGAADADFNAYLGMSRAYTGDYRQAIPLLLRAEELSLKTAPVYEALGFCFFHVGDFAKAAEFYRKAVSASPKSTEARNNAARAHVEIANRLLETNRTRAAAEEFRRALEVSPDEHISKEISRTLEAVSERLGGSSPNSLH